AIWQKNQAAIMAHIVSENTSVLNVTDVKKENNQTPTAFTLSQNYPNPFNPSTVIKYSVPKSGIVTLKVYNMLGQEVATLVNQMQNSGNYIVNFNANNLASGVYMYRIQSGDFTLTKKMELLK
ncbi:MAG: T9SS type A sorting domain-containing protein, partial [Ignavibacteriaceae bacterium]